MKRATMFLCVLALIMALPSANVYADSLSCSGGIISTGDRSSDVIAKCGSPDSKESHLEEVIQRIDADTKQKVFITVEEWTYNFGTNQLMRIIILKNGEVTEIRTGNYGYTNP